MSTKTKSSIFDPALLRPAIVDSFKKLDQRVQWQNPVMFVVLLGTIPTTFITLAHPTRFGVQLTLLSANCAEAMTEGRGKAQAAALRKMRTTTMARRVVGQASPPVGVGRASGLSEEKVSAAELRKGDVIVCEAGDTIPGDGEVIEGIASVEESAITGESAPVSAPPSAARISRKNVPSSTPTISSWTWPRTQSRKAAESFTSPPPNTRRCDFSSATPDVSSSTGTSCGKSGGPKVEEQRQYLRVHIGNLRKKIEEPGAKHPLLKTEPGIGYRFAAAQG